ncbi:MAG: deoxyguanosinetriphosphate triphosphohydrolase, partial [Nevskiales bacterium]
LKHCSKAKARELGDIGERFINGGQPGLEAQLANLADEIAYNNHDVDDGLRAGLISVQQLSSVPLFNRFADEVEQAYPGLPPRRLRHEVVRRMINHLVSDLISHSHRQLADAAPADIRAVRAASGPLLGFSPAVREENTELKRFLHKHLYRHTRVHRMTAKAQRVVKTLFGAFLADPQLLPARALGEAERLRARGGEAGLARAIADYVAGMTDRYAIDEHERIFDPRRLD